MSLGGFVITETEVTESPNPVIIVLSINLKGGGGRRDGWGTDREVQGVPPSSLIEPVFPVSLETPPFSSEEK